MFIRYCRTLLLSSRERGFR